MQKQCTWMFAGMLALSGALAQGCSSPAGDDEAGSSEGASTIGVRFTKPFEVGAYDSADGTLVVDTDYDGLEASIFVRKDAREAYPDHGVGMCRAPVDVTNGLASICSLKLQSMESGTILVTGEFPAGLKISDRFQRRARNALVGRYSDGETAVVVEASSDDALTFTFEHKGEVQARSATARSTGWEAYLASRTEKGTRFFAQVGSTQYSFYVSRRGGEFAISPWWTQPTGAVQEKSALLRSR